MTLLLVFIIVAFPYEEGGIRRFFMIPEKAPGPERQIPGQCWSMARLGAEG